MLLTLFSGGIRYWAASTHTNVLEQVSTDNLLHTPNTVSDPFRLVPHAWYPGVNKDWQFEPPQYLEQMQHAFPTPFAALNSRLDIMAIWSDLSKRLGITLRRRINFDDP